MSASHSQREVLPCPFCAATWGSGITTGYKGQPATSWHIYCMKCKATGPAAEGGHTDSIADAANLWNKRQSGLSERDAALEEAAQICDARFAFIRDDHSGDSEYFYLDELENAANAIRALKRSHATSSGVKND